MNILFVTPYLPVKGLHGGGGRMYSLIRELSREHGIFLVSFVENEHAPYLPEIHRYCAEVRTVPFEWNRGEMPPTMTPELIWRGYSSPRIAEEICGILSREAIDAVSVEYLLMASYVPRGYPSLLTIHEPRHLALKKDYLRARGRERWRCFWRMLVWMNFEMRVCSRYHRLVILTEPERRVLKRLMPSATIDVVPTGADGDYFRPRPDTEETADFAFVGNYCHPPNVDAMRYFCKRVLPAVRREIPSATLRIIGYKSRENLAELGKQPGVEICGRVDDIRPYLAGSRIFINPVRLGAGIRGKLLEAFAMAKPVITSSLGAQGLEHLRDSCYIVADDPDEFASKAVELLNAPRRRAEMGGRARKEFESGYDWRMMAGRLSGIYREMTEKKGNRGAGHD